jgi:hypothetical protein
MTTHQHTIFILVGIVEVLLCVTSALGFAGTIAKKLAFVRAYAYFLYFHFLLNFGVATYLASLAMTNVWVALLTHRSSG